MALAFAAGNTASNNTGVATTGSLGTTVAGQLIVITISDDSGGATSVTSVTDLYGNTWTKVPIAQGTSSVMTSVSDTQMWYAVLAPGKAGALHTVTVNWSTAATGRVTVAAQYFNGFTGTPTLDQKQGAIGTSNSASAGTTPTTTNANELIVLGAGHSGVSSAFSLGAGYTNLTTVAVANAGVGQESKVVAATGTQTGTMSIASSLPWGAIIATFYDQPASTTATPPTKALTLATFAPVVSTPRLVIPDTKALALITFPPAVLVKTQSLFDDFEDNVIDTAKWPFNYSSAAGYAETGGKAVITLADSTIGNNYAAFVSGNFDLTESYATVKVDTVPNSATGADATMQLVADSNNNVEILYEGGTLYFRKKVAGATTNIAAVAYNATNHKFWQIRETGGTVYWETSPTAAPGSWTTHTSQADPINLTSLQVNLAGGTYQSEVSPGTVAFDSFNVLPLVATPPTKALTLATFAPVVSTPRLVIPDPLALTLTPLAPVVTASQKQLVTPPTTALTLTRYAPSAIIGKTVTPGVVALTLTTFAGYVIVARKPPTAYSRIAKPLTPYDRTVKPDTTYNRVTKPPTAYSGNPGAVDGVTLDDMTVTLDSLTMYLNGYLTSDAPDASATYRTQYGRPTKPRTAYR